MSSHFSSSNHKEKRTYDNFPSAWLECNKYNSKTENIGKKSKNPYLCKICKKIHVGTSRDILSLSMQQKALNQVHKTIGKIVLVDKIDLSNLIKNK